MRETITSTVDREIEKLSGIDEPNSGCTHNWSFIEKSFQLRFQWLPTVSLEWDSNLAKCGLVVEEKQLFEMDFSANFLFFFS